MVILYYHVDDKYVEYDDLSEDVFSYLDSINVERFVNQFVIFCNTIHPNRTITMKIYVNSNMIRDGVKAYYLTKIYAQYGKGKPLHFYKAVGWNNVHPIRKQMLNLEAAFKFASGV